MDAHTINEHVNGYTRIDPKEINPQVHTNAIIFERDNEQTFTRRTVIKKVAKYLIDMNTSLGENLDTYA